MQKLAGDNYRRSNMHTGYEDEGQEKDETLKRV